MKGKQGKQNRKEYRCCLFIGCIFKFVNLLYDAYPEFTHSVFLFLVSDMMQNVLENFCSPQLLIFGKFSNPPTIPSPRLLVTKEYV